MIASVSLNNPLTLSSSTYLTSSWKEDLKSCCNDCKDRSMGDNSCSGGSCGCNQTRTSSGLHRADDDCTCGGNKNSEMRSLPSMPPVSHAMSVFNLTLKEFPAPKGSAYATNVTIGKHWYMDIPRNEFLRATGLSAYNQQGKLRNLIPGSVRVIIEFIHGGELRTFLKLNEKDVLFQGKIPINTTVSNNAKSHTITIPSAVGKTQKQVYTESFATLEFQKNGVVRGGLEFSNESIIVNPINPSNPHPYRAIISCPTCCLSCYFVHQFMGLHGIDCICCFWLADCECGFFCGWL